MLAAKAMELLEDPERCSQLRMEDFNRLLVRAGYSKSAARKASLQRGWDRLTAGQMI